MQHRKPTRYPLSIGLALLVVSGATTASALLSSHDLGTELRDNPQPTQTTIVNGLSLEIDPQQTAEEKAAAEANPPFSFPDSFLQLTPGPETTDYALDGAGLYTMSASTDVQVTEAVISADGARAWLAGLGSTGDVALNAATGDIAITLIRVGPGELSPPHIRPGLDPAGPFQGDTIVSLISGPDRVSIIALVDWDSVVAPLLEQATVTREFDTLVRDG